jgi:hypothetical protein
VCEGRALEDIVTTDANERRLAAGSEAQVSASGTADEPWTKQAELTSESVAFHVGRGPELSRFQRNLDEFIEEAAKRQVPASEITRTLQEVQKLVTAPSGAIPREQRLIVAEQILMHGKNPSGIDQGFHQTCGETSLAEWLFTKYPSKAAGIISSMAIDGRWTGPHGQTAAVHKDSLKPGVEESNHPPKDGDRSHAIQLSNLALCNDIMQRAQPPMYYFQLSHVDKSKRDTGERITNAKGEVLRDKDGRPETTPLTPLSSVVELGFKLTGEEPVAIWAVREGAQSPSGRWKNLHTVENPQQLRSKFEQVKNAGKLPVILLVDNNHPELIAAEEKLSGKKIGYLAEVSSHAMSMLNFDSRNDIAKLSNQAGLHSDVSLDVDVLFKVMRGKRD